MLMHSLLPELQGFKLRALCYTHLAMSLLLGCEVPRADAAHREVYFKLCYAVELLNL